MRYEGAINSMMRRMRETQSEDMRQYYQKFLSNRPCSACEGRRIRKEALGVKVRGQSIAEVTALCRSRPRTPSSTELDLKGSEAKIAAELLKEIRSRLRFLLDVGLGYLTLDRPAPSLSGGEGQRIRLASQIGSELTGVIYVLDEPSIGLHQRDNQKLLAALKHLRDIGNSVVVVEHDREAMEESDWLVDFGPGAGRHGGQVVAAGTPAEVMKSKDSLTGRYLRGRPARSRSRSSAGPATAARITVVGARENNLKDVTVAFPLGMFVCVTGVSGAGKSTLVNQILYPAVARALHGSERPVGAHDRIDGLPEIDKVIDIDQSPIGRTPRSNPATYTKLFDLIRDFFALLPEARMHGYTPGRFSFNVKGGRCEACEGDGVKRVEMHFLADVYVPCEVCQGKRFNEATLQVKYNGLSIADVLDTTVDEALVALQEPPADQARADDAGRRGPGLHRARPELAHALRRRGAAREALARALQALDRPDALHPGRAHDRPPLRGHQEAAPRARPPGRGRQHGGRHRAQPRRHQDRRLDRRHRPRGRRRRRARDRRGHAGAGGGRARVAHRPLPGRNAAEGRRAPARGTVNAPTLVFVGVSILSMRAPGLERDRTVVVTGDRITYAGPSASAPDATGAKRIDGAGRFLMPGLADMHVHLHFPDELGVYLAHGITTVRNMRGEPRHLAWRDDVRAGRLPGPTIYSSGPTLGGSPLLNPDFRAVDSPAEAGRAVAEQASAGYDLVKVHSRLKPDTYEAIAQAGRDHRLPVAGHYLAETGMDLQIRERQASLEHVGDMERLLEADPSLARRIADAGTFVTPLIATDYERTAPPASLSALLSRSPQTWAQPRARTRLAMTHLASAGVRLLIGTDASLPAMRPGESLGLEMRSLRAAGLTARQVLEAATRAAGAFVQERIANPGAGFGTIEAGARADLLLLDANPLEDPRRALSPRAVVANGRLYEASVLDRWALPPLRASRRLFPADGRPVRGIHSLLTGPPALRSVEDRSNGVRAWPRKS